MSKFVITGGAGYIGGYMTIRLLQDGHIVKVIDKNPKNSSTLLSTLNDVIASGSLTFPAGSVTLIVQFE